MKVEVKKIDSIKRELRFEVSKERVSKALEGVYLEIGKIAKVKGFRKGKIRRERKESCCCRSRPKNRKRCCKENEARSQGFKTAKEAKKNGSCKIKFT